LGDDAERIKYAFRLVYGRAPAPDEIRESHDYLKIGTDPALRWASLMRVLLASNEFLTLD
jgi:hypothetical protein